MRNGTGWGLREEDRGPLGKVPRGVPTAIVTILVLTALLIPGSALPKPKGPVPDLLIHFVLFAGWFSFTGFDSGWLRRRPVFLILILVAFAVGTESLQLLVEGRHFDPLDIAFNVLGAGAGYLVSLAYLRLLRARGRDLRSDY